MLASLKQMPDAWSWPLHAESLKKKPAWSKTLRSATTPAYRSTGHSNSRAALRLVIRQIKSVPGADKPLSYLDLCRTRVMICTVAREKQVYSLCPRRVRP